MMAMRDAGQSPFTTPIRMADGATDEKWRAYPHTILEFFDESGRTHRFDLRRRPEEADRRRLARLGLDGPFAVFTAQNPEGENAEDAASGSEAEARDRANDRRQSRLEGALRRAGIPYRRVDGVAPDGEYREECVAAIITRDAAVELAAELRQLALFWFDGHDFWLLPADADEQPVRLPR